MKLNHLVLFALLPFALWSCSDDSNALLTPPNPEDEGLKLEIILPTMSEPAPATRALDATDECEVQTIDVLAFNAGGDKKFLFHAVGDDIEDHSSAVNGNRKVFYVKIPQGSYSSVNLMIIANAHAEVEAAKTAGHISTSKTKDEVIEKLTFSAGAPWPVKPGVYTRFPMWGLSGDVNLTAVTITIPPIDLLRAVAKIDVGVNFTGETPQGLTPDFKLEDIYVYNTLNKVQVAPTLANYTAVTKKVTAPSVPTGAGVSPAIRYELRSYNTAKLAHMNEIYVAEHAKGHLPGAGYNQNFCLVVGGKYNGGATTYYRVDFIKTTRDGGGNVTNQEFLPILRNHRYKVNITKVHGPGYATPAAAFAATGLNSNLQVEIIDNDEDLTEFVYDGQYALGVGKGEFLVDKNQHTNIALKVGTTHTQGWTATASSTGNWLTITSGSGSQTGQGKSTLKFNTTAYTGAVDRVGHITITSGRMEKKITVTQHPIAALEIVGKRAQYLMDASKNYSFTVKSAYAWKAKIKSDTHNIILKGFTPSGSANLAGTPFNFKLENDVYYQTIIDQTATLTFYSETDEFAPVDVPIRGVSAFDLGGVYVYYKDQPIGGTWYLYANRNEGDNSTTVPPAAPQLSIPRANSCASIAPQVPGKPWRLPTDAELNLIIRAAWESSTANQANLQHYGFTWNVWYWSATTYPSHANHACVRGSSTANQSYNFKTNATVRARCVRSK